MVIINTQFSLVNFMEENAIETSIFINTLGQTQNACAPAVTFAANISH
jgi:hypothetical protein